MGLDDMQAHLYNFPPLQKGAPVEEYVDEVDNKEESAELLSALKGIQE